MGRGCWNRASTPSSEYVGLNLIRNLLCYDQCLASLMTIPRLSEIAEHVETLFPPATPFDSVRLYRGEDIAGTDGDEHEVTHDFRILSGEAMIRTGRPVLVSCSTSEGGTSVLDVFCIYPISPVVRVGSGTGTGRAM